MTYAEVLIRKGKRGAAAYVQAECNSAKSEPSKSPQHLIALLDHLLHPEKPIDDQDTIDWVRWLVGGGRSYDDFAQNVREYDNTAMCGLVWTADFVAFRCRTCGISQCMSLCADCFKHGNHEGHDFNMFKSQAGGACDCGDASVMKESGFCSQHHGSQAPEKPSNPPTELMCVAENMVPRIILRLVQHLRVNTVHTSMKLNPSQALDKYERVIETADRFLKLLHDFSSLGAAMRTVMTKALVDDQSYFRLTNVNEDSEYANFMRKSKDFYEDALRSLPNPDPPREFQDCPALTSQLSHRNFLEELVFWTVKYEFPEKLVCLLLKMLPDSDYKEAFTRSFVLHYSRVSMMLVRSSNSDKLSNRVVHVSVQLFSNEDLALAMTESLSLLHIMVSSLKNMMSAVLIPMEPLLSAAGAAASASSSSAPSGAPGSGLVIPASFHTGPRLEGDLGTGHTVEETSVGPEEPPPQPHMVVDCSKHVMRDHCYWPLVSDLNNVLSHPPIAFRFMGDNTLLTMWFDFLKMFQGMNLNVRISGHHVEFEPNTYYASFSGELEASASPMWALVSHIRDRSSREYSENVIRHCLTAIREWLTTMVATSNINDPYKASFHIPLHRYFAVFVRQVVKCQGFSLQELLPDNEMLTMMMQHPLRVQAAFYEIMCGLWIRNGLQIKGQAMTYIQCHFCKSMVDADLFLLQLCATKLPTDSFINSVLDRFQIRDWLLLSRHSRTINNRIYRDTEQELQMIESTLIFLVSILSLRTNLGLDEEILARLEMVSLLCMGDKTHSMLYDHMPEKCGTVVPLELFDKVLGEVAQYSEPRFEASGNMQQGMYLPKPHVWEELYDPIYVLLRAVHRREFQTSIERFNHFAKARFANDPIRSKTVTSPWPPWRLPTPVDEGFEDPRKLLHSKFTHGFVFNLLYKAVHGDKINDFVTSLAVHLLELAVTFPQKEGFNSGKEVAVSKPWFMSSEPVDLAYDTWYPTDWLSANLRHFITVIFSRSHNPGANSGSRAGQRRRRRNHGQNKHQQGSSSIVDLEANEVPDDDDDEDDDLAELFDEDKAVAQSMEVDQVSDVSDTEEIFPSDITGSISMDDGNSNASMAAGHTSSIAHEPVLALTGPPYSGTTEIVPSSTLNRSNSMDAQPPSGYLREIEATINPALLPPRGSSSSSKLPSAAPTASTSSNTLPPPPTSAGPLPGSTSTPGGAAGSSSQTGRGKVTILNESMITLLLQLHSKYSGRPDSYIPCDKRTDGVSTTKEYRESRVGDACFFIEKVLDRIYEMDDACAQNVEASRKHCFPHYHAQEAQREAEQLKKEAEERKKKAKERQRKMMEQLAAQRRRFEINAGATADAESASASTASSNAQGQSSMVVDDEGPSTSEGHTSPSKPSKVDGDEVHEEDMETTSQGQSNAEEEPAPKREVKLYHCCHCKTEEPASDDRPIGLVTLIQSTSVLAHKHRENAHLVLPTSDEEAASLSPPSDDSLGQEFDARFEELIGLFDPKSVFLSVHRSWRGGIHIQSCGHHMHYSCRKSYCETLKQQMRIARDQALDTDHGEFICPLCRQMANALLPVPPEPPDMLATVFPKDSHERMTVTSNKIHQLLAEPSVHLAPGATELRAEMSRVMELFTKMTLPQYRMDRTSFPTQAVTNFISSIARTNLETDLVQRGGSLVDLSQAGGASSLSNNTHTNKPKFCFVPLMHVLGIHMNALPNLSMSEEWGLLTGRWKEVGAMSVIPSRNDVPLLLQDPLALLIHFMLVLPINIERAYFDTITKACYNLHLVQIFVRLTLGLSRQERENLKREYSTAPAVNSLVSNMGHVVSIMEKSGLYANPLEEEVDITEELLGLEPSELEASAQELALPFLRVASLIRHYVLYQDLPVIPEEKVEFSSLMKFLDLAKADDSSANVCQGLNWFHAKREMGVEEAPDNEIDMWCANFVPLIQRNCGQAKKLLQVNLLWRQPSLLRVPKNYDEIFQFYHKRKCNYCGNVPKDPTVCLMCGTMVCLKEVCCKVQIGDQGICETVKHSWDCGGGTGIFLAVNSSTIVVIRGKRACIWGSIYLDVFGEEDKELKRGKPLYLHAERYHLLEQQWKTHKFDHTSRKWVMHRDTI